MTEPDIMLVLGERIIICIEAKFGSGNPLAHPGTSKPSEKPTDRGGLLRRYLDRASARIQRIIHRDRIGLIFHSQLFRNVMFASEMADKCEWPVVSLMSDTQRKTGRATHSCSFDDPGPHVRPYLGSDCLNRFHFRTWEGLYPNLIAKTEGLRSLAHIFGQRAPITNGPLT
jgi:hypothetical protein